MPARRLDQSTKTPPAPPPDPEKDPQPAQIPTRTEPNTANRTIHAPITITIPRFWRRPRTRNNPDIPAEPPHHRRTGPPTTPSHRLGITAVAALAAVSAATLTGDGHLTSTHRDSRNTQGQAPAGAGPSAGATSTLQPLTLAAADPFNPDAGTGAPTISIPGIGAPPGPAAPTVQPAALPAAAPAAPLPATPTIGQSAAPHALSTSGIPARAKTAYTTAATRMATLAPTCRLPWTLLAAIGRIESNHARAGGSTLTPTGRATPAIYGIRLDGTTPATSTIRDTDHGTLDGDPTYDRAVGPLQFLPATWRTYATDADHDGVTDPQDIDDAALTAGRYLCTGTTATTNLATQTGQWNAAYRYNHSVNYANLVLALATTYTTGKPATVINPPTGTTTTLPTITITITITPTPTIASTPTTTTSPTTTPATPTTPTTPAQPTTATVTSTSTSTSTASTTTTATSTPTTTTVPSTNPGTVTVTVITVTANATPTTTTSSTTAR